MSNAAGDGVYMMPTWRSGGVVLRAVAAAVAVLAGSAMSPAWAGGGEEHDCGGSCLAHRLEALRWVSGEDRARPGFDPLTGRDLLNYPPHRHVEYRHMKLEIDIPDMAVPRLNAVQRLRVAPIGGELGSLSLNAALLEIERVEVDGREAAFEHDGSVLRVKFDPPLTPGAASEIVTRYSVNDPPYGLLWTLPGKSWPGRAAQIHTQGQPEDNRYWFPMHDFPNVQLSTELVVTVPAGYRVLSNGRLVSGPGDSAVRRGSRREAGTARHTYHWLQEKPHAPYLVSLVVGQFDVVDVAARGDPVPMPVYVPPGRGGDVQRTYGNTSRMMELFARLVDEPYPWDQYAQAVVHNFAPGGMENTSATTMHDTAILTERGHADQDMEGLISHELAHQWFGDLLTCNSWEHIWLNEGFATYFTNLWLEHREGGEGQRDRSRGRDAYFAGVIGNFDRVIAADKADAPYQPAMASKVYDEAWDVFRRAANPYPKGASVLHMLRQRLGDELFFRSLSVYIDRFKGTTPETNDLRKVMEEVSGESLEQFFAQWVYRPGVPSLDVDLSWDRSASELVVEVLQRQNIDGYNPAFEFVLPVWVETMSARGERNGRMVHVEVSGREAKGRFVLEGEPPTMAVVDPELTVLAGMRIRQSVRWWEAQLADGPTLFAKVRAVRALAGREGDTAAALLLTTARGAANHPMLRAEAARALGRAGHAGALLELAGGDMRRAIDHPDVRVAVVESLARAARREGIEPALRERVVEALAAFAGEEQGSYRARAEALSALGQLGTEEHLRLIISAADSDSQHDRVRQGALRALGELGAAEGLATAIRYSLPGTYNRTRPVAMAAVAKLAKHDMTSSLKVLTAALGDRERRAWEGAGEALVAIGDRGALEPLARLLETKRDERDRRRIREWISKLDGEHAAAQEADGGSNAREERGEVVEEERRP